MSLHARARVCACARVHVRTCAPEYTQVCGQGVKVERIPTVREHSRSTNAQAHTHNAAEGEGNASGEGQEGQDGQDVQQNVQQDVQQNMSPISLFQEILAQE